MLLFTSQIMINLNNIKANYPSYKITKDGPMVIKTSSCKSKPLPSTLFISKNVYSFAGLNYDCYEPGLYRFIFPEKINRQHVVLDHNDYLLTALFLSHLSIRGNADDNSSISTLEHEVANRFLSLTCGPNCNFVHKLLCDINVKSRIVHSHTIQNLNSYNNGHTLIEVFCSVNKKYIVIDIDKKVIFSNKSKNLLTLFELCEHIYQNKDFNLISIFEIPLIDWRNFKSLSSDFSYGFIEQYLNYDLKSTYRRICQFPLFVSNNKFYACAWDKKFHEIIKSINSSYSIVDSSSFFKKFY